MEGKIYAIKYYDFTIYIGQTVQPLQERFKQHLYNVKKYDRPLYNFIKQVGNENIDIVLIKDKIKSIKRLNRLEVLHIHNFRTLGHNILNIEDGGHHKVGNKSRNFKIKVNGVQYLNLMDCCEKLNLDYKKKKNLFIKTEDGFIIKQQLSRCGCIINGIKYKNIKELMYLKGYKNLSNFIETHIVEIENKNIYREYIYVDSKKIKNN